MPSLSQVLINGVIAGAGYSLIAVSFVLIYSTVHFLHVAHGAVYTAAAYCAFALIVLADFPIPIAVATAILSAAVLGMAIEVYIYRPLRHRGSGPIILLLSSFGILIAIQNSIALIFGDTTRSLRSGHIMAGIEVFGGRITPIQITTIAMSVFLFLSLWAFLYCTKWGKLIRAVANDRELGATMGVNSESVLVLTFGIGSALAGTAAILSGYDMDLAPMMGFKAVLMGIVAVIVGGIGSVPGAFLGGYFIGVVQHFGVLVVPLQWQDGIIFATLIIFLILRPQGFLGKPLRRAGV